jgi:taurine dioxygenase
VSQLTREIIGLDPKESAALEPELAVVLYDPDHIYRHTWHEGDLLVWDNQLGHDARAYYDNAQTRVLRRCAIADDDEPEAVAV